MILRIIKNMKSNNEIVAFAVTRWIAEVKDRPLSNVHRRTLDDTWRKMIRFGGGDPDELVGPSHDALLVNGVESQILCNSSHGGAGYADGSYWNGDAIICGICGYRIENPPATGSRFVQDEGFWGRFWNRGYEVPTWDGVIG